MKVSINLIFCALLAAVFISCNLSEESKEEGKKMDQLIILGDSNSDPGNIYKKTNELLPATPPYYMGIFSNGPTWATLVANKLGLAGESYLNLACGGGCSDSLSAIALQIPPEAPEPYASIREKTMNTGFLAQVEELRLAGVQPKPNHRLIIFIGENDYSLETQVSDSKVDHVILSIEKTIARVKEMGWKRIIIFTLNEHASPIATDSNAIELNKIYFELIRRNNSKLKVSVPQWKIKYGVEINLWDFASFLKNVTDNAAGYGFTDLLNPIYEGGFFNFDGRLNDSQGRFFWDFIPHYSAALHEVIANAFIEYEKNLK